MSLGIDRDLELVFSGVLAALVVASLLGWMLSRAVKSEGGRATVANLNARTRAWWVMSVVFALTLVAGRIGSLVLFALLSFLALREYLTLVPTRPADHRTLFWSFFVFTPLQYVLVGIQWYGLFTILIPIYAFLYIPTRIAMAGDTERFLERAAKIQWGLMICVFCVSHAPGLLMLEIPGYENQNAKLLLYLVVVAQLSDVMQYVWGKLAGRHKIAPHVSPSKTWEGFLGGVATATAVGAALYWMTPFSLPAAAGMALSITLMGFFGGLVMSAIKRDRGVKDYGSFIEGHGGILDRIDSICFSAPFFFHLVNYFYTPGSYPLPWLP
jgi:phosphatidate cytidylyltransferase